MAAAEENRENKFVDIKKECDSGFGDSMFVSSTPLNNIFSQTTINSVNATALNVDGDIDIKLKCNFPPSETDSNLKDEAPVSDLSTQFRRMFQLLEQMSLRLGSKIDKSIEESRAMVREMREARQTINEPILYHEPVPITCNEENFLPICNAKDLVPTNIERDNLQLEKFEDFEIIAASTNTDTQCSDTVVCKLVRPKNTVLANTTQERKYFISKSSVSKSEKETISRKFAHIATFSDSKRVYKNYVGIPKCTLDTQFLKVFHDIVFESNLLQERVIQVMQSNSKFPCVKCLPRVTFIKSECSPVATSIGSEFLLNETTKGSEPLPSVNNLHGMSSVSAISCGLRGQCLLKGDLVFFVGDFKT